MHTKMEEEEHLTVVRSSILITVTGKKPMHPDSKGDQSRHQPCLFQKLSKSVLCFYNRILEAG